MLTPSKPCRRCPSALEWPGGGPQGRPAYAGGDVGAGTTDDAGHPRASGHGRRPAPGSARACQPGAGAPGRVAPRRCRHLPLAQASARRGLSRLARQDVRASGSPERTATASACEPWLRTGAGGGVRRGGGGRHGDGAGRERGPQAPDHTRRAGALPGVPQTYRAVCDHVPLLLQRRVSTK
jgi:hypothetical protein